MICRTTKSMGWNQFWRLYPKDLVWSKVISRCSPVYWPLTVYTYGESIVILKDPSEYTLRRDLWNKAFSSSSLKLFEPKLLKRADELMEGLDKHKSNPVDISKWMEYFAYVIHWLRISNSWHQAPVSILWAISCRFFVFQICLIGSKSIRFNFPFEMLKQGNDQHGYRKIIIESMQ